MTSFAYNGIFKHINLRLSESSYLSPNNSSHGFLGAAAFHSENEKEHLPKAQKRLQERSKVFQVFGSEESQRRSRSGLVESRVWGNLPCSLATQLSIRGLLKNLHRSLMDPGNGVK